MATFVWTGATSTAWATGSNWKVAGVAQSNPPTATDDVLLGSGTGATNNNCTAGAGGNLCRSLDCTGYTGTLSIGSSNSITIGDPAGTVPASNIALKMVTGMTFTVGNTSSNFAFVGTSATTQTIDTGGRTLGAVTFTGATGSWQISANLTATGNIAHNNGTLDLNGKTISALSWVSTGSSTRTLTTGSGTILNLSGTSTAFSVISATGFTLTAGGSATVNITGAAATTQLTNITWTNFTFNITGSGSCQIGSGTVANLTRTGTAAKTDEFILTSSVTVTGTLTLAGNSTTNRLLVRSQTVGTRPGLTAATVACSNVDFADIGAGGAGNWDLSAITGLSGDCGGNTGITFTTAVPQTCNGSTSFSWSDVTRWTSRVPLPQDDVTLAGAFASNAVVTLDMPRLGKSIAVNGTGTGVNLASSITNTLYGSWTQAGTWNHIDSSTRLVFAGRDAYTFTTNGKVCNDIAISAPSGSLTLQDNLSVNWSARSQSVTLTAGTFNTNGYTIDTLTYAQSNGTLNASTSTFQLNGTAAQAQWNVTGGTANCGSASITFMRASTNARTFAGFGQTYGTLNYTVANSPGTLSITGANTFDTLNVGSGRALTLPNGVTTTVTNLNVAGSANGYQYLSGSASNYVSVPDSAAVSITGDIDLRARIRLDDYSTSTTQRIIAKWGASGQQSYRVTLQGANLNVGFSTTGSNTLNFATAITMPFTKGNAYWIRVTRVQSTGMVACYWAADQSGVPSSWTHIGSDQALGAGSAIFDSTAPVEFGSEQTGSIGNMTGRFYRSQIRSGIDGTIAADVDFTTKTVGTNTFTESSANAATVTITGALAQNGDGRLTMGSSSTAVAFLSRPHGTALTPSYINLSYIQFSQPYTYYPQNSIDGGNNVNVNFTAVPDAPYWHQGILATGTGTTATAILPYTVNAGNLLVLAVSTVGTTVSTPSGWTLVNSQINGASNNINLYVFAKIATGGEQTLTATMGASGNFTAHAIEVAGWRGTPTLDVTDKNSTGSTVTTLSTTASTGPTNATPAFAIATMATNGNAGTGTYAWTNGFQDAAAAVAGTRGHACSAKPLTTAAAQSTSTSWSSSRTATLALTVFKDLVSSGNFFMFM